MGAITQGSAAPNFAAMAAAALQGGGQSKGVKFAPEVKGGGHTGTGYERRVVFEIKCEAMEENHAIKVLINDFVKFDQKIIKCETLTNLTCSIALDNLDLINNLIIIDQTTS